MPGFSLKDIDPKKIFCEHDFLYKDENGLIRGAIDCAFSIDGKSYLLDLKTHALVDYSEPFLRDFLEKEQYDLQANDSKAFEKYLEGCSNQKDTFAGFLFLFLRNVTATTGTVFYERELICKINNQSSPKIFSTQKSF